MPSGIPQESHFQSRAFQALRRRVPHFSRFLREVGLLIRRAEMPMHLLREARELTQVHLTKILGVNQAAVSKLERRADRYVSTLQSLVKAMGVEDHGAVPGGDCGD